MDFLGLRTLTIIDDTLELIEQNHQKKIDIDAIDFDDDATYSLFSRGETLAIFQFESKGMQEYLMQLKPRNLEEITAMNALYRPGPMENIPDFIDRKFGRKEITYIHNIMEETLKMTYGIIVYQEQVMQLVQVIAGFSLGQADILRRAMGKKDDALMAQQRNVFIEGALTKGVPGDKAGEIFDLIQKFAKYGFNKSHSLAYSYLAYQTAWLKANYRAEFLAANMTAEKNSLDKIVQLIDEGEANGIKVLPPDVNRSIDKFTVVNNQIYFGMSAIKNVGSAAVENIVKSRSEKPFTSFFDFVARVDTRQINKRVIEALICSGAFDSLNPHRSALFEAIDAALNYAKAFQNVDTSMENLFGGTDAANPPEPNLPNIPDWSDQVRLDKEKEYLNFYVSGHPLNQYKAYIQSLSHINLTEVDSNFIGHKVRVCGIVSSVRTILDKRGNSIAFMQLEDFHGKGECVFWSDSYKKFSHLLIENTPVMVMGKSEVDGEKIKVYVDEMMHIDDAASKFSTGYSIWLDAENFDVNKLDELKALCQDREAKNKLLFNILNLKDKSPKRYTGFDVPIAISRDKMKAITEIFGKDSVKLLVG